jgi:AcrR family transcriptional regulator
VTGLASTAISRPAVPGARAIMVPNEPTEGAATVSRLIEHDSAKAARILDSARDLVRAHGARKVTISEIAAAAGVGKGTVYLYWATKEDLIVGLLAREILAWIADVIDKIARDPGVVLPRRLAPLLIKSTMDNPWLRRLRSDEDALWQVLQREADRERFAESSPSAMCAEVITILREHDVIRDDLPAARQIQATTALLVGFGTIMGRPSDPRTHDADEVEAALADAFHVMLEPPSDPGDAAIAAAAEAVRARFTEIHDHLLELVAKGAEGTR